MRIVIDLQPCQNGSRHRGIGRYSMAITRAIIKLGSAHEFIIALNQSFSETIDDVRKELNDLLPQDAFVVFSVLESATAADPVNAWRNRVAELTRSHFIEGLRPDLVFIPSLNEGLWDDTVISVEKDAPYLTAVTLYDLIPLEDPERYLGGGSDRDAYLRRLDQMRRADLILPISHYVAQDAASKLGLHEEIMTVAHCGVESHFVPAVQSTAPRPSLLDDYGITRPYVMTASPLEARKNIEGLIAGFASMSTAVRDAHQLVLLGKMDAFARNYLSDLARTEGLPADTLVFPGFVPDSDLPFLYHGASVFAFPSLSEGFGLPLLEAMACGTPVVGSNRTSIPEVVGREDLLCDPTDAIAIGRTIERILSNPKLQSELRVYGPNRAALFTWENAAAIILDAFERLYSSAQSIMPVQVTPENGDPLQQSGKLRTMAYVLADVPVEHRLAGVDEAIIASLAELFDLTVIDRRCPANTAPLPIWIKANCAVQDADWLDTNADWLDHVIYSTDFMADANLRRLMDCHPGSLLVTDRLSISQHALLGRGMFDGAQSALLDIEGPRGLSAAASTAISAEQVVAVLHKDLAKRASHIIAEDNAHFLPTEPQIGILTTALSQDAERAFRNRVGVSDTAELIVAIPNDERAAEEAIRVFREATVGEERAPTLLLFRDVVRNPSGSVATGDIVAHLFGRVVTVSGSLESIYRGLLSSADMVIVDSALPQHLKMLFSADFPALHVLPFAEEEGFVGGFAALLTRSEPRQFEGDDRRRDQDITGTAKARAVALHIKSLVRECAVGTQKDGLQSFGRRLPAQVRGIRPDGNDIAQLAISLTRNEAYQKPAKLYIDVTAFARPSPTHRLNPTCRKWLEALFLQAGSDVRAVYADGDHFVLANQFTARFCGIDNPGLQDSVVIPRPGDQIVGFDLCHSFLDSAFEALRLGRRRGLAIGYIVLGSLAHDRAEFLPGLTNLMLAWSRETRLQVVTSISALPGRSKALSSSWAPHQHHERAAALATVGLCPNILLCEDVMSRSFTDQAVISDLSPRILELYEKWEMQRRMPVAETRSESGSAKDYGHVVTGHLLGSYSLAIINRILARTLEAAYPGQVRYIPVETTRIDHTEGVPRDEKPLMIEMSSRPSLIARDEIVISHHYPVLVPEGHYRLSLALFFWEESHIPEATVSQLSENFDAIISPARSVTNALIDSGLSIPIATIGQPVKVDSYAALAASRLPRGGQTTFLHVSSSFRRKGIDVLLAAWAKAFTAADNVRLVIKTFPNPHNDVERQVAELEALHVDLAKIEIVNRDVEANEMPQFYAEADVMVLPTRGEGYNLPALEAMAAGLPLIVTGHGGHRDFCSDQEARLIRYSFAKSESHVGGPHSMWVEPDVDDLVGALREHVDPSNFPVIEARRQRAMLAAMRESNASTWLHRYDVMIDELSKGSHLAPARIAWISTWAVQCGIAQYSSYLLDHFSEATRRQVQIICDTRTLPDAKADITFAPTWEVSNVPKTEQILQAIVDSEAEAVVIQHQDGLLSWDQLGKLAKDRRLAGRATIAILHNAGNMVRSSDAERAAMLEGLGKLSRVLVHNIADINFLLSLGLSDNVALLPHGAFATGQAPWPRRLGPAETPVIGCHGFFFRHKGIDKLIRAAALLRQEWPHLKLRLVNARFPGEGHDMYIHECRRLAASLNMTDAIEWYQDFLPIEEINALLASCDVIALPYDESDDSASGAVRVSLASMVPLVATRVKIFAELEEAAEWADNNDPEVLADTLAALLRNPERRRTVQSAMHEWLLAHDWKHVAGTFEGMIHGLVMQQRTGWSDDRG